MKLKTTEELKEEGFIYIATNVENDLEIWARFTGYLDCIQYVHHKEGILTGDIEVITFGQLTLLEQMYHKMLQYPKINQNGYIENIFQKWIPESIK